MCTVCPLQFEEIYGLAIFIEKNHKNQINKSHDINSGPTFKCKEWKINKSYVQCTMYICTMYNLVYAVICKKREM